jgi:16S rRNA (guanine(966)-N(2))-methyltransferase RsmD
VRIIGGDWKRTPLNVIDVEGLRPTPDRVRETVFNWLGQDLDGMTCLDLFAGTGALGFEAASRGARRVLMVERNARAAMQLKEVKARLGAGAIEIVEADALRLGASLAPGSFDVVFLDPPFDSTLLPQALRIAGRLAAKHGVIYVEAPLPLDAEASQKLVSPAERDAVVGAFALLAADGWQISRAGRAGAVHYHLLRCETGE